MQCWVGPPVPLLGLLPRGRHCACRHRIAAAIAASAGTIGGDSGKQQVPKPQTHAVAWMPPVLRAGAPARFCGVACFRPGRSALRTAGCWGLREAAGSRGAGSGSRRGWAHPALAVWPLQQEAHACVILRGKNAFHALPHRPRHCKIITAHVNHSAIIEERHSWKRCISCSNTACRSGAPFQLACLP